MSFGIATLGLFILLAGYGAYSDIRARTIPNLLNGAIAITGLGMTWFSEGGQAALLGLAHVAIALPLGMAVYALGMWGGGDAKFYAASAAWFELWKFPLLAFAIAIAGLVLLIGWFSAGRFRRSPRTPRAKKELPYGVAIAAGGIAALALQAS